MLNSQLEGGRQLFPYGQLFTSMHRDTLAAMKHLSEGSELVICECPACKMFSWQKSQSSEQRVCPFCSGVQPDYVTRIAPEPVMTCEGAPGGCDGVSPFEMEFFMVQGSGFRCMAYRNQNGKWRGAFDDEELPGAIRVLG
jgi:hypothetical protein